MTETCKNGRGREKESVDERKHETEALRQRSKNQMRAQVAGSENKCQMNGIVLTR